MLGLSSVSCSGTRSISLWGGAGHKRCNQPFPACNYVPKTHPWHSRSQYAATPNLWAPDSGSGALHTQLPAGIGTPGTCTQAGRTGQWGAVGVASLSPPRHVFAVSQHSENSPGPHSTGQSSDTAHHDAQGRLRSSFLLGNVRSRRDGSRGHWKGTEERG